MSGVLCVPIVERVNNVIRNENCLEVWVVSCLPQLIAGLVDIPGNDDVEGGVINSLW